MADLLPFKGITFCWAKTAELKRIAAVKMDSILFITGKILNQP